MSRRCGRSAVVRGWLVVSALLVATHPARAEWNAERWRECRAAGMRGNMFAPEDARNPPRALPEAVRRAALESRWRQPLERRGVVPPSPFGSRGAEPLRIGGTTVQAMGLDVIAHDRTVPPACAVCPGGTYANVEPSVAMLGGQMVVTYNDVRSRCGAYGRQGIGWANNGGVFFVDTHGLPAGVPGVSHLSGDPSVAVNARTGDFYLAGFGSSQSQLGLEGRLAIVRARFVSGALVFTGGIFVDAPNPADFYDKPFMAVDSLSGNVYLAWTNFTGAGTVVIQAQRYDANLAPLGPVMVMNDLAAAHSPQFPMPIVGPDGEVYLAWWEAAWNTARSRILVRRSDDFGATFAPAAEVASFDGNLWNGAPGMLREFGPMAISPAIDRTNGPHRGRLYLGWDQAVPHLTHRTSDTTSVVDAEPNNDPDHAQAFVPGGWIRGTAVFVESDWYRAELEAGQSLFLCADQDSVGDDVNVRVWRRASPGAPLRLLANGQVSWGGVLFSAPASGTYEIEVFGAVAGPARSYRIASTRIEPSPGDVARDVRDAMVAWSDDGTSWSAPRRIDDAPQGSDLCFTTLVVDGRGRVHAFWLDYRLDPLTGSYATPYATASGDGGVSWGANRRMGDALSDFQTGACLSNGNSLGDYLHMAAEGERVAAVFPDTRNGDQDIWLDLASYVLQAEVPGESWKHESRDTTVTFALVNRGTHARELSWRVDATDGWLVATFAPVSGSRSLAAGQTLLVDARVASAGCAGATAHLRLLVTDAAIPGAADSAVTLVRCVADSVVVVLASLASTSVTSEMVELEWLAPAFANGRAVFERSLDGLDWREYASRDVGPDGRVAFRDEAVVPSTRYAYRLVLSNGAGTEHRTAAAWIDVPPRTRFALSGARPNPTEGGALVTFSLPGAGAARLDVYDLLGRQVRSFEVGSLGAGEHVLRLDADGALAPGVYLARLSRNGETRRTRFVVTR